MRKVENFVALQCASEDASAAQQQHTQSPWQQRSERWGQSITAAHTPRGDKPEPISPRPGTAPLCQAPCTSRTSLSASRENWELQGQLDSRVKFAPTLCRAGPLKWSVGADGHAPGIAQQWTMHLLLRNNVACCTPWLNKHSSQCRGAGPETPGARAHLPHSKTL